MLLGIMADFNSKSKLLLVVFRWKTITCRNSGTAGDFALMKRQLRAMKALRFQMGSLYFVDKQNVMTVFKIIFDFTINLLILY